jgi:hypothetical protein
MKISRLLGVIVLPTVLTILTPMLEYVTVYSRWIVAAGNLYAFVLACCGMFLLFRRKWWSATIYSLPLLVVVVFKPAFAPYPVLKEVGFRAKLLLERQYAQTCKPVRFLEEGKQEELGLCEIVQRGWDTYSHYILYDTSGEIMWPPQARTQEWKDMMLPRINGRMIAKSRLDTRRIYGPYYDVLVDFEDVDKD